MATGMIRLLRLVSIKVLGYWTNKDVFSSEIYRIFFLSYDDLLDVKRFLSSSPL